MVSEALPLLLSEGLAEALDQLVQLLRVVTQEVLDIFQTLQGGRGQRAGLTLIRACLYGPGDAEDAVALLLVVVEGLVKQDGDRSQSRKPGSQEDLSVLDPDRLRHNHFISSSPIRNPKCLTEEQTFPSSVWNPSSTGCRT